MKYKIFQPYLNDDQLNNIDFGFTPLDNTNNPYPNRREYYLFNKLLNENLVDDLDYWGLLSPLWSKKMKLNSTDFMKWIESNPGFDVYLSNSVRIQEAVSLNVWENGEWYHPGISRITENVLKTMNITIDLKSLLMTKNSYCFCNYFVASKEFWKDYIEFLNKFVSCIDVTDDETKSYFHEKSAFYDKDPSLSYFVFVIERLFSTFLHLRSYKIAYFPYNYETYGKYCGEFYKYIKLLSDMKELSINFNNSELFNNWNSLRTKFLKNHFNLFQLEREIYT